MQYSLKDILTLLEIFLETCFRKNIANWMGEKNLVTKNNKS